MALGVPAFYGPRAGSVWWDWSQDVPTTQASFYTTQPLRDTLEELIDFDYLNQQAVRFSATYRPIEMPTSGMIGFKARWYCCWLRK